MSEQGYYDVTLHTGPGIVQAHVTFPFGQWAELGHWLDEIAPGEKDTLTVKFHPVRELRAPLEPIGHSVRAELHDYINRREQEWQAARDEGRWPPTDGGRAA